MPFADRAIVLETPRLILRHFTPDDLDALVPILGDRQVMRFSVTGVHSRKQIRQFIDQRLFSYLEPGYGLYAVVHKQNRQLIGYCGFLLQTINDSREVEIGYRLATSYWGQGLATEAATTVKQYGQQKFGFRRLICLVEPENKRSIRVAEKIGMKHDRDLVYLGLDVRIYSLSSHPKGKS